MPIYEFFCQHCHTVYNFFSRRIDADTHPDCPRCRRPRLERWVSRFATPSGRGDKADDGPDGPGDARLEKAMETLAGEAESMSEDDPRQAASLMRRFSELSGMPLTGGMQEALQRLEKGEDPERIEEEMGDILEDEPFDCDPESPSPTAKSGKVRRKGRAGIVHFDATLYEMHPE